MPKPNVLVDRISSVSRPVEARATEAAIAPPQIITVVFEGGGSAYLDAAVPRSRVWAEVLEDLRRRSQTAYVEVDPETGFITELLLPQALRVASLRARPSGDVEALFHESAGRHYVRRSHPDFEALLGALRNALNEGMPVLVSDTDLDHEIIDVRTVPKAEAELPSPEAPPPALVPPLPGPARDLPTVIQEADAVQLFNEAATQTCAPATAPSPCIPFLYPDNGCWARAHAMCKIFLDHGVTPEKIWIAGNLHVNTSNHPDCKIPGWSWHVAPTVLVDVPGGPDKRVIDASLFDAPVTLQAWQAIQQDTASTLTPSDWTQYWPWGDTDPTFTKTESDMATYRNKLKIRTATYGAPPYACPIIKQLTFVVDRSTLGMGEVTAMLQSANPAVVSAAFYVMVDGFSPDELGINAANFSGVPSVHPTLNISPAVPGMTATPTALSGEDEAHLARRQRLTWTYQVAFTDTTGFGNDQQVTLTAFISTVSGSAHIYLIGQPNPYEIDGPVSWLSTDLRVFQIKEGESKFGATMGSTPAAASDFIEKVIDNLNTGASAGETFENNISTDQQTSQLELSEMVNGTRVFNFAVAKVRYTGMAKVSNVRVFFRLFPVSTASLDYDANAGYRQGGQGGDKIPLLGLQGGDVSSVPCFAEPRVDSATKNLNAQKDLSNVQQLPAGVERKAYYGCWLDVNQDDVQFPLHPASPDGPFSSDRKSVQDLIRGKHQCLVAEIACDPDPTPSGATPGSSDNLAQRNLSIVESANPGEFASRRIPQTFEIKPTRAELGPGDLPDELMIDWGNVPPGSVATLYLPGVSASGVQRMVMQSRRAQPLTLVDDHTLRCAAAGMTYVPIPQGTGANFPGLLNLDLPDTVRKDQVFTVTVRQVTDAARPIIVEVRAGRSAKPVRWRRIAGSFQITIPVRSKETMLEPEERLLSNLRWIQKSIPAGDRWYPVFHRYVAQVAGRVDALGGHSEAVVPSPSGEDVTLRIKIVDRQGKFFDLPVDIDIKHRTLESEPRRRMRRVLASNIILVKNLRRFPQSDYVVSVTPSDWFHPEGQFITIPASGTAAMVFAFEKKAGKAAATT